MMSFGFGGPPRQLTSAQQRQLLPNTSDWYGRFRQISSLGNDFLIDRELQRRNAGPNGWLEATRDLRRAFVEHPELDRSLLARGLSG